VFGDGYMGKPLLALQPLLEEEDLGADSHIDFIESTLEIYGKTMSNVIFFVGDNCNE